MRQYLELHSGSPGTAKQAIRGQTRSHGFIGRAGPPPSGTYLGGLTGESRWVDDEDPTWTAAGTGS